MQAAYEHIRDFGDFVTDRESVWTQEILDKDSEIERVRRIAVANASYIRVLEEQNEELLELMERGQKS